MKDTFIGEKELRDEIEKKIELNKEHMKELYKNREIHHQKLRERKRRGRNKFLCKCFVGIVSFILIILMLSLQ